MTHPKHMLRNTALLAACLYGVAPAIAQSPANSFLVLSDVHFTATTGEKCGQSGQETSPALWSAAQIQAKALIAQEQPSFLIYLGDLPSHCFGHPADEFSIALNGLAAIAGSTTKLIYVPGNNDSLDGDYQSFTSSGGTPLGTSKAWGNGRPVLNAQPGDMIDTNQLPMGFYSVYAVQAKGNAPALRVIVLNTTIFTANYDGNEFATYQAETNTQLEWLNAQLKQVHAKGEKAIIAMHVPPGTDGFGGERGADIKLMWNPKLNYTGNDPDLSAGDWVQKAFLGIVAAYQGEIVGTLSSHTHYNEIRRLRDCSQKLPLLGSFTELDMGMPSVTTDHLNNPSMKLVSYDAAYEWTGAKGSFAFSNTGAGWPTSKPLTFSINYPCPTCSPAQPLKSRISTIDNSPMINTSAKLASYMKTWLKMGAGKTGDRQYMLALDATCEIPTTGNIK